MLRFFISVVLYSLPGTFPPIPKKNVKMQFESSVDYFPMQNFEKMLPRISSVVI